MEIKRIKKATVGNLDWEVVWDNGIGGGRFDFQELKITIGVKHNRDQIIFETLCHELMEICAVVCHGRLTNSDSESNYVFLADHKTFDTQVCMFASAIRQFIK